MEVYWRAQEALHKRGQRTQRNQTPAIVQQEAAGEIEALSLNSNPGLPVSKLAVQIVVTEFPRPAVRSRGNRSQRLKNFEQPDIVAPVAFCHREREIGR